MDRYELAKYLQDDEPTEKCLDQLVPEQDQKVRQLLKDWRVQVRGPEHSVFNELVVSLSMPMEDVI